MATQLQLRKGTKVQNDAFTGAEGELTYDSTSKGLRIHDGSKQGGYMIDTVIEWQAPTVENDYVWYRKYASGWVEQGGSYQITIGSSDTQFSISLPIAMANVRYTASVNVQGGWSTSNVAQIEGNTTTTLKGWAKSSNSSTKYILWQVSGMAA